MGTLRSQGSPRRELFLRRADGDTASEQKGGDAIAGWGQNDSVGRAATADAQRARSSPNGSIRHGAARATSPTHERLFADAEERVERNMVARQAEGQKKEIDLMAALNQDSTLDFISRDEMLDFISRQERREESRQERLRLARAAGLESFHRGEPIDRVANSADSPRSGFREQPAPRPLKHTEAWVADQAERHLERQRKVESKAADYHAAQMRAMTRDSLILRRRAESKERAQRGGASPARSEPELIARLSRDRQTEKTAALKARLEEARQAELTFSPQLNRKSVKLASKREVMKELAGIDTPASSRSPQRRQLESRKGALPASPTAVSRLALSPADSATASVAASESEQADEYSGDEGSAPDSPRTVRSIAVRRHFGVEPTTLSTSGGGGKPVEDTVDHSGGSDSGGGSPPKQGSSPRGSLFGRHRASGSPRRGATDSRRAHGSAQGSVSPPRSQPRDAESEEEAWQRVQARRAAKLEEAQKEQAALQRARAAEKQQVVQRVATASAVAASDGHAALPAPLSLESPAVGDALYSATLDAALGDSFDLTASAVPTDGSSGAGEVLKLQADRGSEYADALFPDGVPPMVSPSNVNQNSAVAHCQSALEAEAAAGLTHPEDQVAKQEASPQVVPVDRAGLEEADDSVAVAEAAPQDEIQDAEESNATGGAAGDHLDQGDRTRAPRHPDEYDHTRVSYYDDPAAGTAAEAEENSDADAAGGKLVAEAQPVAHEETVHKAEAATEERAATTAADADEDREGQAVDTAADGLAGLAAELGLDSAAFEGIDRDDGGLDRAAAAAVETEPAAEKEAAPTAAQVKPAETAGGEMDTAAPPAAAPTPTPEPEPEPEPEPAPAPREETVEEAAADEIAGLAAELGFDASEFDIELDSDEGEAATEQPDKTIEAEEGAAAQTEQAAEQDPAEAAAPAEGATEPEPASLDDLDLLGDDDPFAGLFDDVSDAGSADSNADAADDDEDEDDPFAALEAMLEA